MDRHEGGCLCGAIRYVAMGPMREIVFCHCSQCRKQTGLYVPATAVPKAALDIAGDSLRWFAASGFAERGFCATCGTPLFWRMRAVGSDTASISIMAGSLDDASDLVRGYHICTEGRATFYAISDGLPQYAHDAPGVPING